MRILGLSGSLRRGSYNSALLEVASTLAPCDVVITTWRKLADIPAFDEDLTEAPAAVEDLRREIAAADAVLFATPEYNGSVPGALKNALDWVSRPFPSNPLREKPVAVIGASAGIFGAVWAQAELRKVLTTLGANVSEHEFPLPRAGEAFTDDRMLRDPELVARLRGIVLDLAESWTQQAA